MEIASDVKKETKFAKNFTVSVIQNGLQSMNNLSTILYLNDYYNIHCVIHNQDTNKYYQTTLKKYPILVCIYKNNKWNIYNDETVQATTISNVLNATPYCLFYSRN